MNRVQVLPRDLRLAIIHSSLPACKLTFVSVYPAKTK